MRHDLQRVFYSIVRFLPLNIDNGPNPAVIVFKSRVVQTYGIPFHFFLIHSTHMTLHSCAVFLHGSATFFAAHASSVPDVCTKEFPLFFGKIMKKVPGRNTSSEYFSSDTFV